MRWGLLSPYFEGEDGRLLRIQPVFPYFLKAKLADVDEAVRAGLATGFKEHYRGLGGTVWPDDGIEGAGAAEAGSVLLWIGV